MKTKQLLLVAACTAMLVACNKNEKDVPTDPAAAKEAIVKDSIKKAEIAELELIKQDSIDASQIKSYLVKKISGKQKSTALKTSIKYSSIIQEIDELKKQADKEMWTKEKLDSMIDEYKKSAIGGIVELEIERYTIDAANTEYFSIIVKDSNDVEIYREDLKSSVPNVPNDNHEWWNVGSIFLPKRIKAPFYVYVVDKIEETNFKYEVTAVKK